MSEVHLVRLKALLMLGDLPAAEAALQDYRHVAEEHGLQGVKRYVERLQVQLLYFQRGRLSEAESRFRQLDERFRTTTQGAVPLLDMFQRNALQLTLGTVTRQEPHGDPDAQWPWLRMDSGFRVTRILSILLDGRAQEAAAAFEKMARGGFADIPRDGDYLFTLAMLCWVAVQIDDRDAAQALYGLLKPYAHLNAVNRLCFYQGSVAFFLGILAHQLQKREAAAGYFEQALAMNHKLEHRYMVDHTRLAQARLLMENDSADSRLKAEPLLDEVVQSAREMGVDLLINLATDTLRRLKSPGVRLGR
jgi:tetratricopeptide (TPR) repeat protein